MSVSNSSLFVAFIGVIDATYTLFISTAALLFSSRPGGLKRIKLHSCYCKNHPKSTLLIITICSVVCKKICLLIYHLTLINTLYFTSTVCLTSIIGRNYETLWPMGKMDELDFTSKWSAWLFESSITRYNGYWRTILVFFPFVFCLHWDCNSCVTRWTAQSFSLKWIGCVCVYCFFFFFFFCRPLTHPSSSFFFPSIALPPTPPAAGTGAGTKREKPGVRKLKVEERRGNKYER